MSNTEGQQLGGAHGGPQTGRLAGMASEGTSQCFRSDNNISGTPVAPKAPDLPPKNISGTHLSSERTGPSELKSEAKCSRLWGGTAHASGSYGCHLGSWRPAGFQSRLRQLQPFEGIQLLGGPGLEERHVGSSTWPEALQGCSPCSRGWSSPGSLYLHWEDHSGQQERR